MLEKFEEYLGQLPLTKVIRDRVQEIISINEKIETSNIQDIFICELKNEDGARNYTSLWLFSEKYCIECKNFLTQYDFDITPIIKNIGYCSVTSKNFNFEEPNENSSIKLHFSFSSSIGGLTGLTGDIIATDQNCMSALSLYKKYIISNLVL